MRFSALTLDDCKSSASLHKCSFAKGWEEATFRTFLRDPLVFGFKVEREESFAGFILSRGIIDEAEILTLAVATPYKRQGVGSLLLEALIDHSKAAGINKLFLEVAEDNQPAQAFYVKLGFNLIGKRENYYPRQHGPAVPALTMSKPLIDKKRSVSI